MSKYLSHSQVECWSQCPRRWYLEKVEHAPQAPAEALILGDAVHQALEADGRVIMDEGVPGHELDALLDIFQEALGARLQSDDPNHLLPPGTLDAMEAKGRAILRAYAEKLQPSYTPIAVEESFTVEIPGAPGWFFTGRIDARVMLADGTPALADFKTGKAWSQYAEHAKPQATAYLWAEQQQGGATDTVVFCIFPTAPDGQGGYTCRPQFRPTTRIQADLTNYATDLRILAFQIETAKRNNDFPCKLSKLCAWCGVRGSCPEGEAHLIQIGYAPRVPSVRRELDEHEEGSEVTL